MCRWLTQINIPSTVTSIGNKAFMDCCNLKQITIPSSVTSIGIYAFSNCFEIKEITIPSSVNSIGEFCFDRCSGLEQIIFPSSCTVIEKYLFSICSSLKQIIIPSSVISIKDNAFNECKSLKQIEIPSSVNLLGKAVFTRCYSLEQIIIPSSITFISDCLFSGCYSLKKISIPPSVTSIGQYAFSGCLSLTDISIPSSLISIGHHAFEGCQKLGKFQLFLSIHNEKRPPFILFENEQYCSKNLEEYLKNNKLSKVQKVFIIYQIVEGMKYFHSQIIIHNNLIPSNIFISDDGLIKISGFENCQLVDSYLPNQEIKMKLMEDVYSFGDIVYYILTDGEDANKKNENTLKSFPLLAKQLIDACCNSQPACRPTFEFIFDVLEKNNFNLISLSEQEINEILQNINEYKSHF